MATWTMALSSRQRWARTGVAALVGLACGMEASPAQRGPSRCADSQSTPLSDLTTPYRGLGVGLYPGGQTAPSAAHISVGLDRAKTVVRPLDLSGVPDARGKIALLSIGMSNTASEFERFIADAGRLPALNRHLSIVNGSLSGADTAAWRSPDSTPWQHAVSQVSRPGSSARQVQVLWVKQARLRTVPFPDEVAELTADLTEILRFAKRSFPNLQIVYVSSRTRAGAETRRGPGEPQAYETAFAVRRLVAKQIETNRALPPDVPWVSWGPYLWAAGSARSDGLVWNCDDLEADGLHPSKSGIQKVADQILAFFATADTATPWFLEPSRSRPDLLLRLRSSASGGPPPLSVTLAADVTGSTEYFWSFGDGTHSRRPAPRKTFHLAGVYKVLVTVTDRSGGWAQASVNIAVQ